MRAIVVTDHDNVATALAALEAGEVVTIGDRSVALLQRIPVGHKIALTDIASGQAVVKYGQPIGVATTPIRAGEYVHTHNLASSRGRGDLGSAGVLRRTPL